MTDDSAAVTLAVVLVGALTFGGLGGLLWYEQVTSVRTYEPVEATVVSSEVTVDTTGQDINHYAEVSYRYTVDGQTYTSANVLPGPGFWLRGEDWARGVVSDHPEGATVTAYYDPVNPSDAFLVKDTSPWPPVLTSVGVLIVVLGIREVVGSG